MHYLVTGCAGFVGSQFIEQALEDGYQVTGVDNFSTGFKNYLKRSLLHKQFTLLEGDLLDSAFLKKSMAGIDRVFHFAASADIRYCLDNPMRDIQQNFMATANILEAMRAHKVTSIVYASTGAIYGESQEIPTPEDCQIPFQTSLYGAMKFSSEALIQAYCHGYDWQGFIFRFVSLLGPRYSHGHVFDFCKQLKNNPSKLTILGNGLQRKSYLHIQDCLMGIKLAIDNSEDPVNLYNLGHTETCIVNDSVDWICDALSLAPERAYTGGQRGWVGDNPFLHLDCSRISALGFSPNFSIKQGIFDTVQYLEENSWLFSER